MSDDAECIFEEVYDVYEILEKGPCWLVRRCVHRETGRQFAVKVVEVSKAAVCSSFRIEDLKREATICHTLKHSHIVELLETYSSEGTLYLVFEFMEGADLFYEIVSRVNDGFTYSETVVSHYMRQILSGIRYCHQRDVIHRDIRPHSVLLATKDTSAAVKIGGFAHAIKLGDQISLTQQKRRIGSGQFSAPEVLRGLGYGKPSDIWSCGVILYTLLCGSLPFAGTGSRLEELICRTKFQMTGQVWDHISSSAKDMVSKMLVHDPTERHTAVQLLEHPWIKQRDTHAPAEHLQATVEHLFRFNACRRLKGFVLSAVASDKWITLENSQNFATPSDSGIDTLSDQAIASARLEETMISDAVSLMTDTLDDLECLGDSNYEQVMLDNLLSEARFIQVLQLYDKIHQQRLLLPPRDLPEEDASVIAQEIVEWIEDSPIGLTPEVEELHTILTKPHVRSLLQTHDVVAREILSDDAAAAAVAGLQLTPSASLVGALGGGMGGLPPYVGAVEMPHMHQEHQQQLNGGVPGAAAYAAAGGFATDSHGQRRRRRTRARHLLLRETGGSASSPEGALDNDDYQVTGQADNDDDDDDDDDDDPRDGDANDRDGRLAAGGTLPPRLPAHQRSFYARVGHHQSPTLPQHQQQQQQQQQQHLQQQHLQLQQQQQLRQSQNVTRMRLVQFQKNTDEPMGITLKVDEEGRCIVARIMHGGMIHRQATLHVGDEIIEINGISVANQSVDSLQRLLRDARGSVTFKIVPTFRSMPALWAPQPGMPQSEMYIKCMFNYDPTDDELIPCTQAGVSFRIGQILQVINRDDANWWQVRKCQPEGPSGLVPSPELQEWRLTQSALDNAKTRAAHADESTNCSIFRKRKKDKDKQLAKRALADDMDMACYEEVMRVSAFRRNTLVLLGAHGVGRRHIKNTLIGGNPDRYAYPIPHTTRAPRRGEESGHHYHFVTQDEMLRDIATNQYLEYGSHEGAMYGTKLDTIRSIIGSGKTAILDVEPQALKVLRCAEFSPFVVFIAAPPIGTLLDVDGSLERLNCESTQIANTFGRWFDRTIVNTDIEETIRQLRDAAESIHHQEQWVPVSWIYR